MAQGKLSFYVKRDANAVESWRKYILSVRVGCSAVEAPRCSSLNEALERACNYIEYTGERGKIKIEIEL